MDNLFALPFKVKKARKPYEKTQRSTCRRCKSGQWGKSHNEIYCSKFDLCLFTRKSTTDVYLSKNDQAITCDGKEWNY